jgi:hypothetical protein
MSRTSLAGFWDELLQTTENIATQVINRPQYEPPSFPYYPTAAQQPAQQPSALSGTLPLLLVGGLVLYLAMGRRRK